MPSSSSSSATSDRPLIQSSEAVARRRLLAEALASSGADALLIVGFSARDPNLAALLGPVHLGEPFVVVPRDGEVCLGYPVEMERDEAAASGFALLGPAELALADLVRSELTTGERLGRTWLRGLEALGLTGGRLALAGRQDAGVLVTALQSLSAAGWQVEPGDRLLMDVRKRKTPWELAEVRRSAEGICAAMRSIASLLGQAAARDGVLHHAERPLTAGDLRRIIDLELGRRGLGQPEGNIVSTGADSAVPHTQGDDSRILRPAESIVVDLYPKGHLYADCTRTFCVGSAPDALAEAHAKVIEVLEAAASAAFPGVAASDLQSDVYGRFESAGYDTQRSRPGSTRGFVHSLGHGVGFEVHELPRYHLAGAGGTFAAGDVFTLEPALYDPERAWGVRLENLYLMQESGPESLTPLPLALDPRAW